MKKMIKIMSVILMIMVLLTFSTNVIAAGDTQQSTGTMIKPENVKGDNSDLDVGQITDFGNDIAKIITTGGIIISVIILTVLGIKYMMGSAEEKAEYKKTLMPYVIGAAFVFAASTIASIIYTVATSFNS